MIKNYFTLLLGRIRFKMAKYKADQLHDATGKRFYVLPYEKCRLLVVCNNDLRQLKKRGAYKGRIDHLWISSNCLYFTNSDGRNFGKMADEVAFQKEQLWYQHLEKKRAGK